MGGMSEVFVAELPPVPEFDDAEVAEFKGLVDVVARRAEIATAYPSVRDYLTGERSARKKIALARSYLDRIRQMHPTITVVGEVVREHGRGIRVTARWSELGVPHETTSYPRRLGLAVEPPNDLASFMVATMLGWGEQFFHKFVLGRAEDL